MDRRQDVRKFRNTDSPRRHRDTEKSCGSGPGAPCFREAKRGPKKILSLLFFTLPLILGSLIRGRQSRIQGTVILRAVIDKAGNIIELTPISGRPMLVPTAVDAVQQWRYSPYILNGDPVEVETTVTLNFNLAGL